VIGGSSGTSGANELVNGRFLGMFGFDANGTEAIVQSIMPAAGTVQNFFAFVQTAPSTGNSWTLTVRKNAANTLVTCTIAGTAQTCSDTTHTAVFVAGDLISISIVASGSPSATPGRWSAQYAP
jgi:hypothetical protein